MGVQPSIRQIGKYTVLDVIGTGGMGIVFRAQDPAIGRTVAIKMLKNRDGGNAQDRFDRFFLREMKSTGNLHHQNIVTVYDAGEHEGSPYLVMEYLEGEPVSKLIFERRPLPLLEKLDLVIQVCDGLQYAHDRNVIHRDIKPANVILLANRTAKIVDFGVARIAGSETSLAQTGQLVGSLSYMSPEQINSLPLDGRSDIFSTGVMLYELLTNEVPFKGTDPSSIFVKILREEPLPLSNFIPDIPPAMQAVMNRALAKNVQDRYQSAEEFGFDLLGLQKDLKASTAADALKRGEAAMQRGDLDRARVLFGDVIRLDRHNERANRLLREIRSAIQNQQRSGQVIQIRSQAQVALAGGQFEEALACADQALRLNPDDTESIKLCDEIRNAISRAKAVRDALNRAEAALFAGDFDEAKEAVEESLRLDPSDSEARALASVVNKELQERFRRQQVQEFVDQARQGIAERKFNDALDALHRAEELDPTDSNVRELLQWAQRGQEQENRRRYLQEITDQIEKALHAGDFSSACTISEMGLQRIPGEPTLTRLRAISEKQRDIAERRRFVHDQSLAVKALTDENKLYEAAQLLTEALRRFPGEPNLESLLAITKAAIERQQFEREEAARKKAAQRAENEARAQLTQQVLNWSVELRRSLDTRAALVEVIRISKELRVALEGKQIDDHAREVASLVLNELNARMRARDQAMVELEHLHRAIERSLESFSVTETESRLLSIKAAFPNEASVQKMCADLANSIAKIRETRDHSISLLSDLAQEVETTPSGELTALQEKARQLAAGSASDPRAGALLQQIDSSVNRRFERRAELVRDVTALLASLSKVHSLDEISRISDRATAIAALDSTDDELADQSRKIDAEAGKVRDAMESLLRDMAALGREVASAATIRDADALVPRVKALADRRTDFQTLQEAATRILAEAQGRRIEQDLTVQELEATLTAIPLLETDEELSAAASRAVACRELHRREPAIQSLSGQVVEEVERILRERSELRARQAECDNAIRTAEERLRSHDLESALEVLLTVEAQNPERVDLHLQISLVRRAIEQRRLEQQQLEEEQCARDQAEADQRARRRAIEEAIQRAQELISAGQREESLQCLRTALEREPGSQELASALESTLEEAARQRAEQDRLEQARLAQEQADAEARARKETADQAIEEGMRLLLQGRSAESLQCLRAASERDPRNPELEAALQSIVAEIAREKAEQERLERERLAREQAEAEARARKATADKAIHEGRALLGRGQNGESVQCLRSALERDPGSQELEAELQSTLAVITRQHAEMERLAREAAEALARKGAAERAIQEAARLLTQGQGEESVQCLRSAMERDPGNEELESALQPIVAEVARQQAERERVTREEAEARTRKTAGEQAVEEAMRLLAQGQGEESVQRVRSALERDPKNKDLLSTLESIQAEIERRRAEQKRLERERAEREQLERERAEAEANARKAAAAQAIEKARKLFAKGKGEESLQCLSSALDCDPENADMRSAWQSIQTEVDAQQAEKARLAWEQAERERVARERAEAEARARKEAVDRAIHEARALLAGGRGEECLQPLRTALDQDPANAELQPALDAMQAEVARWRAEQERLERERLEQERIAKEKAEAEARARHAAAEQAIEQAQTLLEHGREEDCLQCLHSALDRDPESSELRSWLELISQEIGQRRAERERLERERLEQERIAKEKAEAEARARHAAAEQAIKEARGLLADGLGEKSVERLRSGLEQDPTNQDLVSALESVQEENARRRAEQERQERERLERERIAKAKAEADARERRAAADKAIKEAQELLGKRRGDDSLQHIRAALGRDPDSHELQSAVRSIHAEVARQRAEQERLERERLELERIAREKAAAEARARQAAAEQAIKEARELFAQGRCEESVQRLRVAVDNDPSNPDVRSTLNSLQAEVARRQAEQERLERERLECERVAAEKAEAEARALKVAAEKAIKEARGLLARKRGSESLQCLREALARDPDSKELQAELSSTQAEIARQSAEQKQQERERLERERIAAEKADADVRARKAAAEKSIKEARALLDQGRSEESLQMIRRAIEGDPKNAVLRSTLESIQEEIARQRAEQKRLERERAKDRAKDKVATEALARKAEADKKKSESARLGVATGKAPKTQRAGSASNATEGRKRAVLIGAITAGVLVAGGIGYVVFHSKTPPQPPQPMAEVKFTVEPADGALTVDGRSANCPGQCTMQLKPGRHSVKLEKPGFDTKSIDILAATPPEPTDTVNLNLPPPLVPGKKTTPLAILGHSDAGSVTLDGNSSGSLPGQLDLGELTPGTHLIVVSEHGQKLTIQAKVSDEGGLNVDGASGLNQVAVVSVAQAGNEVSIYCRCSGAEVQIDGRKPKPTGRDRYSFNTHGKATFNLTVQPIGKFKPIAIYVADATHAAIHVEPIVQIADPADLIAWNNVKDSKDVNKLRQFTAQFPTSQFVGSANETIEDLSWDLIKGSGQIADLTKFVADFPNGRHVSDASKKIDQLKEASKKNNPPPPPPVEPDVKAWNGGLKDSRDVNALRNFRARFPDSLYARPAYDRMDDLTWSNVRDSGRETEFQQYLRDYPDGHHVAEARGNIASLEEKVSQSLVLQTLDSYRSAYEAKDWNALRVVWISAPPRLQKTFKAADRIRVTLTSMNLEVNGDSAAVTCRQQLEVVVSGQTSRDEGIILFSLKRQQGKWIIENAK